ncbi:MAG TPA: outer membrane lipoprotein carrier protein LolA [Bacteroidia bacterium]|nr:outer membrane lipoprotein carrier protein LolA [Bacteroidia bacterium]
MGRYIFITALLIFGYVNSFAQPKGFTPIQNVIEFKEQLSKAAKNTNSIKSNFVQEKNLNVLSEKIISKGEFKFKKQNKVRMEYTTPFKYLLVINNDKVMIKDSQKSNSFSSRSNKLFTVINNIIIDCVQGTALDNKDFRSAVFKSDKNYLITLTPVKKDLKEYFETINVYLDNKDFSVSKLDMMEPTGDNTIINFLNKEINATIPDAEFVVN